MSETSIVIRHDFDTAAQFFNAVQPTSELWHPCPLSQFIFRGHADVEWKLVPSALRQPCGKHGEQRRNELTSLQRFWHEADRQGLPVPGDNVHVRPDWIETNAPGTVGPEILRMAGRQEWAERVAQWPPRALWHALAVAQHHGIPTRLLDWTRLAGIAAYFAARGAGFALLKNSSSRDRRLAIWACHENILFTTKWIEPEQQFVHLVVVPRAGNPNLHAQHGVFTLQTPHGTEAVPSDGDPVEAHPFDQAAANAWQVCAGGDNMFTHLARIAGPPLRLLTLPWGEAGRLLELLNATGIAGSAMWPGFDGAAKAVRERTMREALRAKT